MILTALKEMAERDGLLENIDYEEKRVAYLIKVGHSGKFLGLISTKSIDPAARVKKPQAKFFLIPSRSNRVSNDWPEFMVDKAEYVLGWPEDDSENKVARARRRQALFLSLVREAYEGTDQEEGLGAVLKFLENLNAGDVAVPKPDDWTSGDLFGFICEPDIDSLASSRPAVSAYWSTIRNPRVQMNETKAISQCLVTGEIGPVVLLHPKIQGIPPISDTKGGVPLSSTNKEAFASYDLGEIGGAGVSIQAADAYGKALEYLLAENNHHVRLSEDTVVVFWSAKKTLFMDLFVKAVSEGDSEAVRRLYGSPEKGTRAILEDPSAFYALILSGARGRGSVRSWLKSTVSEVAQNVRQHFEDLEIRHDASGEFRPLPLWRVLLSTAALRKNNAIVPGLAADMFTAILNGKPYPRLLLDALVRRAKAEKDKMPWERAAAMKAYFNRVFRFGKINQMSEEVKNVLDKKSSSVPYRLGRLFSVLEKLQKDATKAGTTIRDRYWGSASATPVVVFPQLFRKAPHHIAKVPKPSQVFYDKLIQEIVEPLPLEKAFPSTLTLEEQGLFALGYYQQMQDFFTKHEPSSN